MKTLILTSIGLSLSCLAGAATQVSSELPGKDEVKTIKMDCRTDDSVYRPTLKSFDIIRTDVSSLKLASILVRTFELELFNEAGNEGPRESHEGGTYSRVVCDIETEIEVEAGAQLKVTGASLIGKTILPDFEGPRALSDYDPRSGAKLDYSFGNASIGTLAQASQQEIFSDLGPQNYRLDARDTQTPFSACSGYDQIFKIKSKIILFAEGDMVNIRARKSGASTDQPGPECPAPASCQPLDHSVGINIVKKPCF